MLTQLSTKKIALLAGASMSAMLASSNIVVAQEKGAVIEEILVTAQKRSQSVQDVPIAMSAFDQVFTKRVNLDDVKDLVKFAPGFSGDTKDSFIDYINVRGISTNDFGIGGDPSVGFFKNGFYQGRNGAVVSSLFDLDRAEVLRGPQGFLFGRNAISGAISFHTARPDFDAQSGYIDAGIGERGILEGEAAINLPVSENFAVRVAGYTSHENGYITNNSMPAADKIGGHDKTAGRITAALRGDNWDATLTGEYEDREGSGSTYRAIADPDVTPYLSEVLGFNVIPGADPRSIDADAPFGIYDNGEIFSITAEINVDLGAATLTSLTGYKDHNYQYAEDFDGTAAGFNAYGQDQTGNYFEQELRLVSQTDGPLSWYAGVSYYKENIDTDFKSHSNEDLMCGVYYYAYYGTSNCSELWSYWEYPEFTASPGGLREDNQVRGNYHGWGAYVDMTYAVNDKFDIGFGIRYTKDTKDFAINVLPVDSELGPRWLFGFTTNGFVSTKKSWDDFTPRVIARYRPNDDMMLYASVTKGYKSGGFGSFGIVDNGFDDDLMALPGATPNSFDPETVWSYEIGVKGNTSDNRLRYDINAYHYKYSDLQLTYWDTGSKVGNVGKVKAYGVEGSLQAVVSDNLDLILSGSYNSNEITGANLIAEGSDGNRLANSPAFKASGLLSYHYPINNNGEINASAEFATQSSTFGGIENSDIAKLGSWTDVSMRLGYESNDNWKITAYVENVFDKVYFDASAELSDYFPAHNFGVSRPRTFGLRFSYHFGK